MSGPWTIQVGVDDSWRSDGTAPRTVLPLALDVLRDFARRFPFVDWRLVDADGCRIVEIHPGARGTA